MEDLSQQLREGMEVYTKDGAKLGKISQVWYGDTVGGPATGDAETCFEVHRGFLGRDHMYLPCRLVASVDEKAVSLSVDEATVQENPAWHRKPAWIS